MATSLGYGSASTLRMVVKNNTTGTILEGEACKLPATLAVVTAPTGDIAFAVEKSATADTADGVAGEVIGVAAGDIAPGQFGEIIVWGPAKVRSNAAISANVVIGISSTNARFSDIASASHQAPMGISMEAASGANELIYAFVDFIRGANDVSGATIFERFYGRTY